MLSLYLALAHSKHNAIYFSIKDNCRQNPAMDSYLHRLHGLTEQNREENYVIWTLISIFAGYLGNNKSNGTWNLYHKSVMTDW